MEKLKIFLHGEDGASMVEYGLLLAFMAVVLITASKTFVNNMATCFKWASATINDAWSNG